MEIELEQLIEMYKTRKEEIQKRLKEFKDILNQSEERVFAELAFCICTPQSKAISCWDSICALIKNNLLFDGNGEQIENFLIGVRFQKNKSRYIVEARKKFTENGMLKIKEKILSFNNSFELRDWLIENVKGLGIKEASHFIRNVGFGDEQLAILDRHILKNLKRLGMIEEIPKNLTKNVYLEIENRMTEFSKKIRIPMYELDMLLWSKETGKVFK